MRFKDPDVGDIRVKKFFAFLPITIGTETRWLETVEVQQIRRIDDYAIFGSEYYWKNINFIDKEQ